LTKIQHLLKTVIVAVLEFAAVLALWTNSVNHICSSSHCHNDERHCSSCLKTASAEMKKPMLQLSGQTLGFYKV